MKKEIHFVSLNYASFSRTILGSHTSDKSHFYKQTPQITDTKKTQNAFFKESNPASPILTLILYVCDYQR